ncbi:glycosyltransferase [Candidatus Parvarchaeota archaeon]|nr:glycosyltransferase [Candidatus Parvarchaeota archaeon]
MAPFFSIIIPTYQEKDYIRATLDSVKRQNFTDYEIIVCDFGSTDGTVQIAKEYGANVLNVKSRGSGFARNLGAVAAKGRFLVFLDADTTMWPDCLEVFKVAIDSSNVAGFPSVEWATDTTLYNIFRKVFLNPLYFLSTIINIGVGPSCCSFYNKQVFLETHGFDETTEILSNIDLNREVRRHGRLDFVVRAKCFTSDRRIKSEGFISYYLTIVYAFFMKKLKNKTMPLDFFQPVR